MMEALRLHDLSSAQLTDAAVVRRVLSGEKALFEILMRRYNQKLYRVIRSYLRDQGDVEDAMQETYLKAYNKLEQFKGDAAFSTWLIRIGINEALLRLRILKKQKFLFEPGTEALSEKIIQLPDTKQMNPEKLAIGSENRKLVEQAIDQLPEKYRVIYVMKEVEGLDHAEIAACLDISDSNVKVRLHRARTLLKEALYQLSADRHIFEFGNAHCDAVVKYVMERI